MTHAMTTWIGDQAKFFDFPEGFTVVTLAEASRVHPVLASDWIRQARKDRRIRKLSNREPGVNEYARFKVVVPRCQ